MPLSRGKLDKLQEIVEAHLNWFTASILGEESLSESERQSVANLPLKNLDFITKSYLLGRFKAIMKTSEWKDFTWEGFLEKLKEYKLSELEHLVLQQAKLSATKHVKTLAQSIAAGIFDSLAQTTNQVISEASLLEIIRDEVRIALLEKKAYIDLASSLALKTKTAFSKKWEQISRTELHSAKTAGTAQAIINKIDIYKHSNGINSLVSIVPSPGTCPDCAKHYLSNGVPRIFPLAQLMGAGSNADSGTSHKKKNHIHTGWKTTLPALHPNCRCQLVFVPPGYSWVNGKLTLTQPDLLQKAIGDSKLSATQKPKGPPSAQTKGPANPATIPGIKSPTQATVGGTGGAKPSLGGVEVDYISKDKVAKRPEAAIRDTENSWVVPKGAKPGTPLTEEQEKQKRQAETAEAIEWGKKTDIPHAEKLAHLKDGEITNRVEVGEEDSKYGAVRVTIAGNGRGLMKAAGAPPSMASSRDGNGVSQGWASVPHDTYADREAASYTFAVASGFPELVPPTTTRMVDGEKKSMQAWKEGSQPMNSLAKKVGEDPVKVYLDSSTSPKDKEERLERLATAASFQLITGACDAHLGNVLVNPDTGELNVIDMGASFPNGMDGVNSRVQAHMHNAGYLLKMPQKMMDHYEKMSLGDVRRGMQAGGHFEDWEVGQQFMRQQYCLHLMRTEGHLDFEKFMPVIGSANGDFRVGLGKEWGDEIPDRYHELNRRMINKTDPQSLYEGFCKAWLDDASKDENHPHHTTAKELNSIGIFMPPEGTAKDAKAVRASGKHKEHAAGIEAAWPNEKLPSKRAMPMKITPPEEFKTVKPGRVGKSLFLHNFSSTFPVDVVK